jgi:prophage maintenance system killer protein
VITIGKISDTLSVKDWFQQFAGLIGKKKKDRDFWHPDVELILDAHEEAGEITKVRREGFLRSADQGLETLSDVISEAKDKDTVYDAAAVYLRDIIYKQPFKDGNHRTAYIISLRVVRRNGETFIPKQTLSKDELIKTLKSDIKHKSKEEVSNWISKGVFDHR